MSCTHLDTLVDYGAVRLKAGVYYLAICSDLGLPDLHVPLASCPVCGREALGLSEPLSAAELCEVWEGLQGARDNCLYIENGPDEVQIE